MSTIDGLPPLTKGTTAENPPTAPAFLSADDLKWFERLRDRTLGRGFKLVMWETTFPRDRATVIAWLKPQLAERAIKLIEIDLVKLLGVTESGVPKSVNVWSALKQAVPADSVADHQAVLVLYGFEELMYHGSDGRSDLLQQMNVQRDIFVRDYPCWWLLLIHPASRQQWRTVAPDFSDFVALWIEAPLQKTETATDQLVTANRTPDNSGSSVADGSEWPRQLKAAYDAISASRLDEASDLIYSYRAASDSQERTEPGLAVADLLEGDIKVIRGDSNAALRLWRDQALPTFQRLGLERDQSRTLARLGNLAISQGNLTDAQQLHGETLNICQRLAESEPSNAEWQRDLSVSFSKLGDLASAQGDLAAAERLHGEHHRIAQRLAASDPSNAEWQRDLSVSFSRLGDLASTQGNLAEAERLYGEYLRIAQRLANSDPSNAAWQQDLSVSFERLGDLVSAQGNLAEAERLFGESLRIAQRLAASDPYNAEWQRELSVSFSKLGDLASAQGNLAEAERLYGESLRIAQRLAISDPSNAAWQRDLSTSFERLGDLASEQGNLAEAERLYGESLRIAQRLANSDPSNAQWQRDLSVSFSKLGDLASAQGNLAEAERLYGESLHIRQRLAESDPSNAEWQRDLWVIFWRVAETMEQQGSDEATEYWRKAHDALSAMVANNLFVSESDKQIFDELKAKIGLP